MPSYMWGTVLSPSSSKRSQHEKQIFHSIFWFIKRKEIVKRKTVLYLAIIIKTFVMDGSSTDLL
jgi:hypothetical protein